MLTHIRPALVMIILMTILTGLLYPLAVTGFAQTLMRSQAAGSLLTDERGGVRGSSLIGQSFSKPEYLHGRPSAAGNGYDPTNSSGSNLGPLDPKLAERIKGDAAKLAAETAEPIPVDAVTTSGSGLDPDISPAFAALQAPRVAKARGIPAPQVQGLIDDLTAGRSLLIFGEPRVNVLAVNRLLDQRFPLSKR